MKRFARLALAGITMVTGHLSAQHVDTVAFRLHKFEQAIGWERDTIIAASDRLNASMHFLFVDRGSPVSLTAHWSGNLTNVDRIPRMFDVKGSTSRASTIDAAVRMDGDRISMRSQSGETGVTHDLHDPGFTIAGYAPVLMQQLLLQYWFAQGRPAEVRTYGGGSSNPNGRVTIIERGRDTITLKDGPAVLRRYAVGGLIWGGETVWLDQHDALVALVSIDAEFDHFEAVRDGYEPALGHFVSRAAADGAAALAALTKAAVSARGDFALVGATVIDGTDAPAMPDAVVVVRGGRITAVGPRATTPVPADVQRVDVHGKSVLPGLWDMHAHYEQVEWGPIYLAAGVTTARDVGNELEFISSVRDAVASGAGVGPRLLLAGVIDGKGPFALGVEQADTPERGVELVRQYHDARFQQIKIYSSMKLPVLEAVTAEAHRLGMTVTGHVPNGITTFQAIDAGMDQINHVQYIVPMMKSVMPAGTPAPALDVNGPDARKALDFLQTHHTVVDPTLAIFEWGYHPARIPFSDIEPGVLKVAPELRPQLMNTGVPSAAEAAAQVKFDAMVQAVGALHRAGIRVVAGTDQVVPGYSLHREIELYVTAGFTPLEAIQAATIVPARVMGIDSEIGTVTVGKRADLLVVDGNPLVRIEDLRKVSLVISAGRRYDPAALWRSVGFTP